MLVYSKRITPGLRGWQKSVAILPVHSPSPCYVAAFYLKILYFLKMSQEKTSPHDRYILKLSIIWSGEIDSFAALPSCGYMVKCSFIFNSQWSRHILLHAYLTSSLFQGLTPIPPKIPLINASNRSATRR